MAAQALGGDIWVYGALVLAGMAAGAGAGLFGIGGGIVMVPALYLAGPHLGVSGDARMPVAVATSLAVIVVTTGLASLGHYRSGRFSRHLVARWAPGVVLGAGLAGALLPAVDASALTWAFAGILALSGLRLIASSLRPGPGADMADVKSSGQPFGGSWMLQIGLSLCVGLASALMGIGAGTLGVPVMRWLNIHIKTAIACASALGLMIGVMGLAALAIVQSGSGAGQAPTGIWPHIPAALALLIGAVPAIRPAMAALNRVSSAHLSIAFGCYLTAMAVLMAIR